MPLPLSEVQRDCAEQLPGAEQPSPSHEALFARQGMGIVSQLTCGVIYWP